MMDPRCCPVSGVGFDPLLFGGEIDHAPDARSADDGTANAAGGEKGVDKALTLLSRDVYLAMGLLGCKTVAELKERAPDILLVNAMSARRQGGIFDRKKAGDVLQPCLQ